MHTLIEKVFPVHQGRYDSPALILTGTTPAVVTYTNLHQCVSRVRGLLEGAGLARGGTCCICLPNGLPFVSAFLAVLDLQAVAAPLNPASKLSEIQYVLEDLKATVVIGPQGSNASGDLAAAANGYTFAECFLDESGIQLDVIWKNPTTNLFMTDLSMNGDFVALALHTSGTTGRPKGVPLLHSNLQCSASNVTETYGLTARDRSILVMPLFHIHGIVAGMLAPLLCGSCIILPEKGLGPTFWDDFAEHKATWWTATPTHHRVLLSFPPPPPDVQPRFIRSCSSPLAPSLLSDLESTFRAPVLEAYAMTENAHHIASHSLYKPRRPGTVGLPVSTISLKIINEDGMEVELGQRGEIVIRGPSVTPGYLHNPEANTRGFTKDGYFRTGDQGEIDDLGHVKLTGRLKELINKGGEKINPNEVDQEVMKYEAVAEAVAFAMPDDLYGEEVAVALVLHNDKAFDEADLRQWLRNRISDFKVPRFLFTMKAIPRTATGKVQRTALAARLQSSPQRPSVSFAGLRELWSQTLDLQKSSIDEDANFFHLGGNSVQAIRLANKAKSNGLELEAAAAFKYPVFRDMAKHCWEMQPERPATNNAITLPREGDLLKMCARACGVAPERVEDIAPSTILQKRLAEVNREAGLWVMSQAFECRNTSFRDLESVFEVICDRHTILRSRTVRLGNDFYNVVIRERPVWDTSSSLAKYLTQMSGLRVLYGCQQMRLAFLEDKTEGPHLVITMTHTVQDVWTRKMLYDELLQGLENIETLRKLPPATSFCDFARYADRIDRDAAAAFYAKKLEGFDKWSYLGPVSVQGHKGIGEFTRIFTPIPTVPDVALGDVSIVNLAWALSLATFSAKDTRIYFPTVSSGRLVSIAGADSMMGPTLTTIPICIDLSSTATVSDTLTHVREMLFGGINYEPLAAEQISRHFRTTERETLLNCSELPEGEGMVIRGGQAELRLRKDEYRPAYGRMTVVVHMRVWKVQRGLQLEATYDRNSINEKTVELLVDRFVNCLERTHRAVDGSMAELLSSYDYWSR